MQQHLCEIDSPLIVDVGAHVGLITSRYLDLFPNSSIYCFEPDPVSFSSLEKNFRGKAHVHPINLALGRERQRFSMYASKSGFTNSILPIDNRASDYWGAGTVETSHKVEINATTLTDFCQENSISSIDILKLDTQGTELQILQGASDLIANSRVKLIYLEMLVCPTYSGQSKLHETLALLDSSGYELINFYELARKGGRLLQFDALFQAEKNRRTAD